MSDEQERRPGPDETRRFSPFEDGAQRRPAGGHPVDGPLSGDHTDGVPYADDRDPPAGAPGDSPFGWPGDGTRPMPRIDDESPLGSPVDGTRPMPRVDDEDETVQAPRPPRRDSTAILPRGADAWNAPSGPNAAWAGRAEVRPPQPAADEYARTGWTAAPPEEPRGRWWMPILIGLLALILLAALGWGIYLIVQASGDGDPAVPAVTASAAAPETTEATTDPTTAETTEPTTTAATEPTEPTGPDEVTVPALKGLSRQEAEQALARRGLTFREIFRRSDAAAGTVIDSDPGEGQEVPPDTQVTLVIAAEPTATATATVTTTGTGPTQDPGEQRPED